MRTRITICTIFFTCMLACGSQSSSSDKPSDDAPTKTGGAGGNGGTGSGAVGGGDASGGGAVAQAIVFNEIAAVGSTEWIEIANPGKAVMDLSDFLIAGSSKKTNGPKLSDAMKFPAGTRLDPGARIVILTSRKDEPVGPHLKAACLPDGPETCFFAGFGVSATTGEALHFLAPDGSVITSTSVPITASADAGGSTTETRCRLPDLTGDFARCALTPGLPNRGL